MKLTTGQAPPVPEITEPPSVPCELTPEMAEFLGVPHPPTCVRQWLDHSLLSHQNAAQPRLPGLHVSDMGYSRDGGLCQRQLWLRLFGERYLAGILAGTKAFPVPEVGSGKGFTRPDSYGQKYGWELGHTIEEWAAAMLAETMPGWRIEGRNLACNYVHKSGQVFTGELDIFVQESPSPGLVMSNEPPYGRQAIIDIKNCDDKKLRTLGAAYPSNVCQQQAYISGPAYDSDFAVLIYMSRGEKGSKPVWEPEEPKAFYVPRDDEAVERRANEVLAVAQSESPPCIIAPKLTRNLNQGPDSIEICLPWQCEYCPFLDHGCDGALPKKARAKGIWGHISGDNKFKVKPGMEPAVEALGEAELAQLILDKEA